MHAADAPPRAPLALRLAVVFTGALAVWFLVRWLFDLVFDAELTLAARFFNAVLTTALAVALVVLARRHLDRRPWAGLGLQGPRAALRPFLVGAAAFLLPSALGLTLAVLTGWVTLDPQVSFAQILGWAGLLIVLVLLYEALPEELIFRGHLLRNLMTGMAPWLAAVVQGMLFAAFGSVLWVASEGWGVLAERGVMFLGVGIVLGLLRIMTGSVWTCVGFHVAFQTVAQNLLSERFSVDNETGLLLSSVVVAFVFATTITGWFHRGQVDWSRPRPE
ncbi:CPBP family intramembrane glutamic endopeptidase [Brevibacterium album]|uniref:CPBP family intramembrane glutamic endopeptidase n=1 Tax=Brevibacterium album TaxID=417948 RepID=UPI0004299626|nr:CPBP family intramembrane glutamic endopeptidase [Brevibacterium album]